MAELTAARTTVVGRLFERARSSPDAVAILQKRYGVWQRWTWADAAAWVNRLAAGMAADGRFSGAGVAIVSGQRVEALLSLFACQRVGARPLLLHPTISAGALADCCQQAGIVTVIAEDQEQVDKAADAAPQLARGLRVLVIDPKGVLNYRHFRAEALATFLESGAAAPAPSSVCGPDRPAVALYSAGICGDARLLAFSHARILAHAERVRDGLPLQTGATIAFQLALADPVGHFFAAAAPAVFGTTVCFGEGRMPTHAELREVAPRLFVAPALAFERMRRGMVARVETAGGLRRLAFDAAITSGAAHGPWSWLIGRPLLNALGLTHTTWLACAYGQTSAATQDFFAALGKQIHGIYAIADAAGPVAVLPSGAAPDLVPFARVSARIGAGKELQLQALKGEGWIETGDLAAANDGAIRLLGRAVDRLLVARGQSIQAGAIEREFGGSLVVNQAVAVGGPATGITALIELDEAIVRHMARERGVAFTTYRSLAESDFVKELAEGAVTAANARLGAGARIRRHVVLPRPLDPANGELTPSLVVRRACLRNRYANRLAASKEHRAALAMEEIMKIAVVGAGNVGGTLGRRWAACGHEILFGVRDLERDKYRSLVTQTGGHAKLLSPAEAAAEADMVVLATPWTAAQAALASCGALDGKILVDATNPLGADLGLAVGFDDSGGEQVARWAPRARVVKAFNTTGFNVMDDPVLDGRNAVMFVAGDDQAAKAVVLDLATAIGFEAIDAGDLKIARLLEPLAALWIHCAYRQGLTRDYALALIRRGA